MSPTFHQPTTLDAALALKQELGARASFLAGGTDLVAAMRKGKVRDPVLIDLGRVPDLDRVEARDGWLRIGALCSHAALERCGVTALAAACRTVGGAQIRNVGTIGGQIGTASPAGDVSVALIALCAEVELRSLRGARRLPLDQIFLGPGRTSIAPDELLVAVHLPLSRRSDFYKIGKRDAVAISLVMAAASIGAGGDVALGVGCVAPTPLRLRRAEAHLRQHGLGSSALEQAAQLAGEEVSPISDHRGGAAYRRAMAVTLTRRLLRGLVHEGRSHAPHT